MYTPRTFVLVALAAGLAAAPCLAQDIGITEQDVQAAFEAPAFLQAFGGCFAGKEHPAEVSLVVVVSEQGACTLSKTEPMLLPEIQTCVAESAKVLVFPATGYSFEVTYPIGVPEVAEGGTVHPVTVAKPVYAVQPVTTVVVAGDESWKPVYSEGKRNIIGGAVLLGVGGVALVLPGFGIVMYAAMCSTVLDVINASDFCRPFWIAGGVMLAGGVVMMVVGGIKIGRGRRLKAKALQMRSGVSLLPAIDIGPLPGGGIMLATWRF